MTSAVLFDFHNTLVTCDGWLDLEIRTLPARVLRHLGEQEQGPVDKLITQRVPNWEEVAISHFRALRKEVHASGVEISAVEGVAKVFDDMGLRVVPSEVERAVEELEEALLPEVEPVRGVEAALWGLHERGYRLGVVSSAGYPPFVDRALEQLGLRSEFELVVTSAGEGIYKSNPEIYRRAARRLGVEPAQAVHVGDHPRFDVESAKAAGLSVVWYAPSGSGGVAGGSVGREESARARELADAVIEEMGDLVGVVEGLG